MTKNQGLTVQTGGNELATSHDFGQAANGRAAETVFADWQSRQARQTVTTYRAGLSLFADYLNEYDPLPGGLLRTGPLLMSDVEAWQGMTFGIVEGFRNWMLSEGYAVASVNARLSAVKTFARLAVKAGQIDRLEGMMIKAVEGYAHKEIKRIDELRTQAGTPTRVSNQKTEPVRITSAQARALKAQPGTPRGRRDSLIMCLLIDHGLRVSEVVGLTVGDIDLKARQLAFYRSKVDRTQTHKLTADTLRAARAYLATDAPAIGTLLRGSRRGTAGRLTDPGMSRRSITRRVRTLGEAAGIEGLSAHDCRHSWATRAARNGTPLERLRDAGGWSSFAMPLRYIEAAAIANEGVNLGD